MIDPSTTSASPLDSPTAPLRRERTCGPVGIEDPGPEPFVPLIKPLDDGVYAVPDAPVATGLPRCPAI